MAAGVFSCLVACGLLVPQPGTEFKIPALEALFSTKGPPGKKLSVFNTNTSHICRFPPLWLNLLRLNAHWNKEAGVMYNQTCSWKTSAKNVYYCRAFGRISTFTKCSQGKREHMKEAEDSLLLTKGLEEKREKHRKEHLHRAWEASHATPHLKVYASSPLPTLNFLACVYMYI